MPQIRAHTGGLGETPNTKPLTAASGKTEGEIMDEEPLLFNFYCMYFHIVRIFLPFFFTIEVSILKKHKLTVAFKKFAGNQ